MGSLLFISVGVDTERSNTCKMVLNTMISALTFALVMTLSCVQGQVFTQGKMCPTPDVVQGFDVSRYMGKWFSYQEFPFRDADTRCILANYTLNADNTVRVVNVAVIPFYVGKADCPLFRNVVVDGYATIPDAAEPAKLKVNFPSGRTPDEAGDYWVLDTDYDNYTVVYSCQMTITDDMQMGKIESAWVLTRRMGEKPGNLDAINSLFSNNDIDIGNFKVVKQEGCPEWDASQE